MDIVQLLVNDDTTKISLLKEDNGGRTPLFYAAVPQSSKEYLPFVLEQTAKAFVGSNITNACLRSALIHVSNDLLYNFITVLPTEDGALTCIGECRLLLFISFN